MKTALFIAILTLAACAPLQTATDTIKAITSKVVAEYCKGSPNIRAAIRAEFAPAFEPHQVTITCAPPA